MHKRKNLNLSQIKDQKQAFEISIESEEHPKVILCENLSVECVYNILIKELKFKEPDIVISINGSAAKTLHLEHHQQSSFKQCLKNVVKRKNTWIITDGIDRGITKLVGEMASDFPVSRKELKIVGIGSIKNDNELLMRSKQAGKINCISVSEEMMENLILNPYNDVFIFCRCREDEIQFRVNFEHLVWEQNKSISFQILIGGDKETIQLATKILEKFNTNKENESKMEIENISKEHAKSDEDKMRDKAIQVPMKKNRVQKSEHVPINYFIVLLKGSNDAADEICNFIEGVEMTKNCFQSDGRDINGNDLKIFDDKRRVFIHNIKYANDRLDSTIITHILNVVRNENNQEKIENNQEKIENNQEKIENKENVKKDRTKKLFSWAKAYDRADFLDLKEFHKMNEVKRRNCFIKAIRTKKLRFVEFLFQQIDRYFFDNVKMVEKLYTTVHRPKILCLKEEEYSISIKNTEKMEKEVGEEVKKKVGEEVKKEVGEAIQKYSKNLVRNIFEAPNKNNNCSCFQNKTTDLNSSNRIKNKKYIRYLFFWAVLYEKYDVAKSLWKNGENHIRNALIATVICQTMEKMAKKNNANDKKEELETHRREFEELAIIAIREAYNKDKNYAIKLLKGRYSRKEKDTCLDIARKNNLENFLAQKACQAALDKQWNGGIPLHVSIIKMLINIPFGLLTSQWLIFSINLCKKRKISRYEGNHICNCKCRSDCTGRESFTNHHNKCCGEYKNSGKSDDKEKDNKNTDSELSDGDSEDDDSYMKTNKKKISFGNAIRKFYMAPVTKYTMNIVMFVVFLTVFSYVMLIELNTLSKSTVTSSRQMEYLVYIFVLSFVMEEIRQLKNEHFKKWNSTLWNWLDTCIYTIFLVAVILRHTVSDNDFVYCRTMFSISLSLFFIRFMQFYYVSKMIGPKVIMIWKMMSDMQFFLAIYLIALLAYGTLSVALLNPNLSLNSQLLKNIIYNPYWQLFGQIETSYMEGQVPNQNAVVIIANAIFLLFTNVLLLSLLIAIFGKTIDMIQSKSQNVWAFNYSRIVEEFRSRPVMPPPFNVIEIVLELLKNVWTNKAEIKIVREPKLTQFEINCVKNYFLENSLFKKVIENNSLTTNLNCSCKQFISMENQFLEDFRCETQDSFKLLHDVYKHLKHRSNSANDDHTSNAISKIADERKSLNDNPSEKESINFTIERVLENIEDLKKSLKKINEKLHLK